MQTVFFAKGDRVSVAEQDWERGLVELKGTVVRQLSDTHIQVRIDDGLLVAAPVACCTLVENERDAA